jgi:hypothetical protein
MGSEGQSIEVVDGSERGRRAVYLQHAGSNIAGMLRASENKT